MIGLHFWRLSIQQTGMWICTLLETNISPEKSILKMIFLFPRWDMLISWRVTFLIFIPENWGFMIQLDYSNLFQIGCFTTIDSTKNYMGIFRNPGLSREQPFRRRKLWFFFKTHFLEPSCSFKFWGKNWWYTSFNLTGFAFFWWHFFCFNTSSWDVKKAPQKLQKFGLYLGLESVPNSLTPCLGDTWSSDQLTLVGKIRWLVHRNPSNS